MGLRCKNLTVVVALLMAFASARAFATAEPDPELSLRQVAPPASDLAASELYARTRLVLEHFGVQSDQDHAEAIHLMQRRQTLRGFLTLLSLLDRAWKPTDEDFSDDPQFTDDGLPEDTSELMPRESSDGSSRTGVKSLADPESFWSHHAKADRHGVVMAKYRDLFAQPDFSVDFSPDDAHREVSPLVGRLAVAGLSLQSGADAKPLTGLRVAIDPGHHGNSTATDPDGKYIQKGKTVVREPIINLQTALLVKAGLEALGAEVHLTREDFAPVYPVPLKDLPFDQYARYALHSSIYDDWFQEILNRPLSSEAMLAAFDQSARIKTYFSRSANRQWTYYSIANLWQRLQSIERFKPDITLIIHYDVIVRGAKDKSVKPGLVSKTKVFVPGALSEDYLTTHDGRVRTARLALDQDAWVTSLSLARSVVNRLSKDLSLPFDDVRKSGAMSVPVEPGVFAWPWFLSRKLGGHATVYIETAHYNAPQEFAALSKRYKTMQIEGVSYAYSRRLEQAAQAITEGVLDFLKASTDRAAIPSAPLAPRTLEFIQQWFPL